MDAITDDSNVLLTGNGETLRFRDVSATGFRVGVPPAGVPVLVHKPNIM
jgi:hypothetical protein